jgi:uncharacterized damage-inducible protein DinB
MIHTETDDMTSDDLLSLLAYDAWANLETARSLREGDDPTALKLMAHVVGAQRVWLARIGGERSPLPVWPELALAEIIQHLEEILPAWRSILGRTPAEHRVAYTTVRGEPFENSVEEIALHVVLHSSYHRGQANASLRAAGGQPAVVDYIHAVRAGVLRE